ncbi:hypothetical protein PVL29_020420 [Vitis rotundifolia]|uniref:Disease resistance protein n=1 Tax=Vitis rotundifolia TaxID=103349 RepID=A0AA38Z364_VITRO|nr:hypothetical protein PVL29_020420 [Vitis rotundifolia]
MADGNITFFLEKLGNFVVQEASLFGEVEGQVRLLRNEMEWMRLVLEDADIDTKCNHDRRLKLWVNQITDVAYDAEDVIDEFMFKIEHQRQRRSNRFLPTCVRFADKLPFIHELDGRIREINITIEKILANKDRYSIESGSPSEAGSSSSDRVVQREKRVPIVEEADVVGMTGEAEAVKQMLVEEESESRVVAIVGMGGQGKTTLAKKVYNRSEVNDHFECRALVYVSQDYRIRELLVGIAYGVMTNLSPQRKTEISNMVENQLGEEVNSYLQDKRYLIVLDDVWSIQVWRGLSSHLPESNKSRVLITTRNQQIALDAYANLYELRPLGEKESWELFLKKTFPFGSTSAVVCPAELEDLGKKITEKCKGLPLAIVVSGGLLSRKEKTKSSWEKVLKSMEWHLSQGPDSCLGILALSYRDLPYFLKSCFLYCGVFPEDCQIKASKLMQMWIEEGFVRGRGEEMVEDVAEEYLEELIDRSMIQVAGRKRDGRVKSCRIHDLLRDLAISKAKDSKFFEVHRNIISGYPFNPRRLIAHDAKNISQHLHTCRHIRSLICSFDFPQESLISCFRTKLLTVLDLTGTREYHLDLPKEIGEFIHLKYFSFKNAGGSLPWSIGKLVNLQILDLRNSWLEIPFSIWKLHQLKHLNAGYGKILSQPRMERCFSGDLGLDKMTNLQTLYLIPYRYSWLESCGLQKLTQLRKLYLYGQRFTNSYEFYPSNLVELKLEACRLEQDPMLTLEKLANLRVLKLMWNSYIGEKMTCSSGGFSQLEFLRLEYLYGLEELKVEEGAMPTLKTLQIVDCDGMKTLLPELLKLKSLQRVNLESENDEFIQEIQTGEEFDKIRGITSIIKRQRGV